MDFFMPVALFTGSECISKNQTLFQTYGKRCAIVTSQHAAEKSGALRDVTEALHLENINYCIFHEICQNPSVESCIKAGKMASGAVRQSTQQKPLLFLLPTPNWTRTDFTADNGRKSLCRFCLSEQLPAREVK